MSNNKNKNRTIKHSNNLQKNQSAKQRYDKEAKKNIKKMKGHTK